MSREWWSGDLHPLSSEFHNSQCRQSCWLALFALLNDLVPGTMNNNAAGVLLPDRRTLLQMQPLYRCSPGSPILAQYHQGLLPLTAPQV